MNRHPGLLTRWHGWIQSGLWHSPLLLLICVVGLLAQRAEASDWSDAWELSPGSGRGLKMSSNGRTLVTLSWRLDEEMMVWKPGLALSEDSARTWTWRGADQIPPGGSASLLAMDGEGDRILMSVPADGENPTRVWLSMTRGADWRNVWQPGQSDDGSPQNIMDGAVARTAGRLLILSDAGLLTSTDNGAHWTSISLPPAEPAAPIDGSAGYRFVDVSADGQTVVVAAEFPPVCIRSDDGGTRWSRVWTGDLSTDLLRGIKVSPDGQRLALVHGFSSEQSPDSLELRVSLSNDAGATWQVRNPGIRADRSFSSIAMSDDGSRILIDSPIHGIGNGGGWGNGGGTPSPLIYSEDHGATWQKAEKIIGADVCMSADGSIQAASVAWLTRLWVNGTRFPPSILETASSGDLALVADWTVQYTVVASGRDLTYQWLRDGVEVVDGPGRTGSLSSVLRLAPATAGDFGTYSVRISNSIGSVVAEGFDPLLPTIRQPIVTSASQEGSSTLVEGAPVVFSVEATGGLLRFQWRRDGQDLAEDARHVGTRTPALSLPATSANDLGSYSIVVSNPIGSVERVVGRIELTVPRILGVDALVGPVVQPGDPVWLRIRAEGGELAIRWFRDGQPLDASTTSLGASTNSLMLPQVTLAECGRYSATISNRLGQVETVPVRIAHSSWVRAPLPSDGWHSAGITADGERMVAASLGRLVTSSNGGGVWNEYPSTNGLITAAGVSSDGGVVFVGRMSGETGSLPRPSSSPDWQPRLMGVATGTFGWIPYIEPSHQRAIVCSEDGQVVLTNPKSEYQSFPFTYGSAFSGYLVRSGDGGAAWRDPIWQLERDPEAPLDQEPLPPVGYGHVWFSLSMSRDGRTQVARHSAQSADAYVSTDAGATWRHLATPALGRWSPIAISPDGSILAVAGLDGIHLSRNLGLTWTRTSAPIKTWTRICLSADGSRLFAVELDSAPFGKGLIHQSADGGQTWHWSGSPTAHWSSIACTPDGNRILATADPSLIAAGNPGGVFVSPPVSAEASGAIPATANLGADGVQIRWKGAPNHTYRILQSDRLGGATWTALGAATADDQGDFSIIAPAIDGQSFWHAAE